MLPRSKSCVVRSKRARAVQRSISLPLALDPRQLSPSMGDYGMDDRHMDGLKGYEDDHTDANPMEPDDVNHTSVGNTSTSTGRRSEAWKHMKLVEEIRGGEKVYIAICNYCSRELSASTTAGTAHLNRHWKRC
jgi:hypothetical protein